MRPAFFAFALLVCCDAAFAQPVVFRGRVVPLTGDALPPDLLLRAEHVGPIDHGQSGEFRLTLPPGTTRFSLRVVRPALDVVYPPGGQMSVPLDASSVTLVVVGPGTEDVVRQALADRDRRLERRLRDYDVRLDARQDSLQQSLRAVLDALLSMRQEELPEILALLRLRQDELRSADERQRAREAHLPLLSATLTDYVLKTRDLLDALDTLAPESHLSRPVAEALHRAVDAYNESYTALDTQASAFAQQVEAHWQDPALSTALQQILTLARGEVHHDRILQLNAPLIVVQRAFLASPPSRDDVRYSQRRIAEVAADLRPRVDRLTTMTNALLSNLTRL